MINKATGIISKISSIFSLVTYFFTAVVICASLYNSITSGSVNRQNLKANVIETLNDCKLTRNLGEKVKTVDDAHNNALSKLRRNRSNV